MKGRKRVVISWNSKQHSNWKEALEAFPKKLIITNIKFPFWITWHKLEWINKRVNVFFYVTFDAFFQVINFLDCLKSFLWVTFLFRSLILSVFIRSMKSELNWTFFTLLFEVLRRSFWLFCKVNKTKTSRRLPCFLIEFMALVEKLGCA